MTSLAVSVCEGRPLRWIVDSKGWLLELVDEKEEEERWEATTRWKSKVA